MPMITLTSLKGKRFGVKPHLIVEILRAPDTVVRTIDGNSVIVRESPEEIIAETRAMNCPTDVRVYIGELACFGVVGLAKPFVRKTPELRRFSWLRLLPFFNMSKWK